MNLLILTEFGEETRDGWPDEQQAQAQALIDGNDIEPDNWWLYLLLLLTIVVVLRLLAIVALARRAAAFF